MFSIMRVNTTKMLPVSIHATRARSTSMKPNSSDAQIVKDSTPVSDGDTTEAKDLEHGDQETKARTTASYRKFLPPRAAIYHNWRHTDSFGLTAGAAGRQTEGVAFGTLREVSKLRLDLYRDWQHTDSFGRMGSHAVEEDAQSQMSDSAQFETVEAGGHGAESSMLPVVGEMFGKKCVADKADGEGVGDPGVKICGESCEGCCEKMKECMEEVGTVETTRKNCEKKRAEEDAVWGRGGYPYTRIF